MKQKHIISFAFIFMLISSCETDYKFKLEAPETIKSNEKLSISFSEKNDAPIDSVELSINTKAIELSADHKASIDISSYRLGKHSITALIFYEGQTKKVTKTFEILADAPPKIYTYKVLNSYPHDKNAYTQGLEIHNGFLYESTGQYGKSSLRKVELKTGKILQQIDLDKAYFGEGITKFGNEIFMLSWKKGIGFVFDFETFEQKRIFNYNKDGWGLTNNGKQLIKTDGSQRIEFLNPETLKVQKFIEAYTNKRKVESLNELEFINDKIYANIYQQNSLLIIDATSGKVEGIADLRGLRDEVEQHSALDVLNGIAFDHDTNKLYVTGKNWSKIFEIELVIKE